MDHDLDVIGIMQGRCAPLECRVFKVPLWRTKLMREKSSRAPIYNNEDGYANESSTEDHVIDERTEEASNDAESQTPDWSGVEYLHKVDSEVQDRLRVMYSHALTSLHCGLEWPLCRSL